jgi:Whirly transcription factor
MMLARQVHRQHGASFSQRFISAAAVTMKGPMSVRVTAAPAATANKSTLTTTQTRSFGDRPLRGYPQYTTHGPDSMFALKVILPTFKIVKGDSIAVDNSKKGKLMIELTPRGNTGYLWTDQARFALSCEEVGLLCSQLPREDVEFVRTPRQADYDSNGGGAAGFNIDEADKVLTVTPGEGESVIFTFDYRKDGNGGHSPSGVQPMDKGVSSVCTLWNEGFHVTKCV